MKGRFEFFWSEELSSDDSRGIQLAITRLPVEAQDELAMNQPYSKFLIAVVRVQTAVGGRGGVGVL